MYEGHNCFIIFFQGTNKYLIWKNIYETNQFLDKTTPTESTVNILMYINKPQSKTITK